MEYSALLEKVSSEQLQLHPSLRDVISRVRTAGLHKVAAQMHNVPEFELRTAAQLLGTRLYAHRQRQMKIASGLRALDSLASEGLLPFDGTASDARRLGAVKVANMFRLGPQGIKNLVPEAGQAVAQQASHAMPKTLGPAVEQSAQHSGMFGNFGSSANDLDLGQTIAKMRNEEMSMGIRPGAPMSGGAAPVHAPMQHKPLPEPRGAPPPPPATAAGTAPAQAASGTPAWDTPHGRAVYEHLKNKETAAIAAGMPSKGIYESERGRPSAGALMERQGMPAAPPVSAAQAPYSPTVQVPRVS